MPERSKKMTEVDPQTLARVEALEERMAELKQLAAELKAGVDAYQADLAQQAAADG